ncbi:MAG: ABC transporter permease [Candidatus Jordarchaeum sp.]|uniref:ABC transporter permease n=1 Tax=Candidatus Jordarchaeum sp. TaxID=2823881 RepID=UPI00404B79C9
MSWFKLAFRNLGRRKSRNILTIIGIMIGIAALIAIISLTLGLSAHIDNQFKNLGVDVLVYPVSGRISPSSVNTIESIPGVFAVGPRINFVMTAVEKNFSVPFYTIDPNAETKIGFLKPLLGHLNMGVNQTVLGFSLAQKLEVGINDNVTFRTPSFIEFNLTVVGILQKSQEIISFTDSFGFVNIEYAENMTNVNSGYSVILVKCWSSEFSSFVAYQIQSKIFDVSAVSQSQIKDVIDSVRGTIDFFLFIAVGLALIVGCLGTANTMAVAVLERRREIGIMKATGAKNRDIMKIFIVESILLGLLGGGLGLAIGYLAGWAVKWYVDNALWFVEFISGYAPVYEWWVWPLGLGIAIFISLIAGVYPAWRASRLKPVETLRYE